MANPERTDFDRYLELGSAEAIARDIDRQATWWSDIKGEQAKAAILVLTMRSVEAAVDELTHAVKRMDKATTRLQIAALVLAVASIVAAVIR